MKKESFEEFLLSKGYDKYSKVENKFIKNSIDCDFSIKYYFPNNLDPNTKPNVIWWTIDRTSKMLAYGKECFEYLSNRMDKADPNLTKVFIIK